MDSFMYCVALSSENQREGSESAAVTGEVGCAAGSPLHVHLLP